MNRSNDVDRFHRSLPTIHPLQRFDSGCPSETDRAPKWTRGCRSLEEAKSNKNAVWVVEKCRDSLPDKPGRSRISASTSRKKMVSPSSAPLLDSSDLSQVRIRNEERRRRSDFIPATPKRRCSLTEEQREEALSIAPTKTTTKPSYSNLNDTKTPSQHSLTIRLAEEIVAALQRAMQEAHAHASARSTSRQAQSDALFCHKCDLKVYSVSSCRYLQCPRCNALNVFNERDPLPLGVGLTYDRLQEVLHQGHPALKPASAQHNSYR